MTNPIYDQFQKAFNKVAAYAILDSKGDYVARVCFKYPADGAGRLWCYVHVISLPMVRGYAGGYGYDKASAAFYNAAEKQAKVKLEDWQDAKAYESAYDTARQLLDGWRDGYSWQDNLRAAGFTVLNVIC